MRIPTTTFRVFFMRFSQEALSSASHSPGDGAIVLNEDRMVNNRVPHVTQSVREWNGGNGDVSDVGDGRESDFFELRTCASSTSGSAYESPLNVSKAESDFSDEEPLASTSITLSASAHKSEYGCRPSLNIRKNLDDEEEPLSADYWKLQADLLVAECELLRLEKELSIRRLNQQCDREGQLLSTSDVQLPHAWDENDLPSDGRATSKTKGAGFRTPPDCTPFKFPELSDVAAYVRHEYRSLLSEEKHLQSERDLKQMLEDEMFCKAAVRQIVAQMQVQNEQWFRVQEILCSLQEEMEVLIETRDLSEKRATQAEAQLFSLKTMAQNWKCQALNAQEKVMMLQSERQKLKLKIQILRQKHLAERQIWIKNGIAQRKAGVFPSLGTDSKIVAGPFYVKEQPILANVGIQEDYALCDSIIHGRNESSRSVDLGTSYKKCAAQRNIKKSLDFSTSSSNDDNTSKSKAQSYRFTHQIPKIKPTRLDFFSETIDVKNGVRHKVIEHQQKVEHTRTESVEPVSTMEHKKRKKVRLFTSKENWSVGGPFETHVSSSAEHLLQRKSVGHAFGATYELLDHVLLSNSKSTSPSAPTSTAKHSLQRKSVGHAIGATHRLLDHVMLSKSKSTLPSAPTSTPLRMPFDEIINFPSSC